MKITESNTLRGIAGVHYVVSELSSRGMIALPTVRNIAAYDVIVMSLDGKKHANIQVKTSFRKRTAFFLAPPSNRIRDGIRDYYILLRWLFKGDRFEGFMLSGREAKAAVQYGEKQQRKRIKAGTRKKIRPSIRVGGKFENQARRWRQRWMKWIL